MRGCYAANANRERGREAHNERLYTGGAALDRQSTPFHYFPLPPPLRKHGCGIGCVTIIVGVSPSPPSMTGSPCMFFTAPRCLQGRPMQMSRLVGLSDPPAATDGRTNGQSIREECGGRGRWVGHAARTQRGRVPNRSQPDFHFNDAVR